MVTKKQAFLFACALLGYCAACSIFTEPHATPELCKPKAYIINPTNGDTLGILWDKTFYCAVPGTPDAKRWLGDKGK